MEKKEMDWLKWRLCYVKHGICVFVDNLDLVNGTDWVGAPASMAEFPCPSTYCHQKILDVSLIFAKDKVITDVFGAGSILDEWCQWKLVSQRLPALVVCDDVVKYGDDVRTVIGVFQRHQVPFDLRE